MECTPREKLEPPPTELTPLFHLSVLGESVRPRSLPQPGEGEMEGSGLVWVHPRGEELSALSLSLGGSECTLAFPPFLLSIPDIWSLPEGPNDALRSHRCRSLLAFSEEESVNEVHLRQNFLTNVGLTKNEKKKKKKEKTTNTRRRNSPCDIFGQSLACLFCSIL